MIILFKYFNNF